MHGVTPGAQKYMSQFNILGKFTNLTKNVNPAFKVASDGRHYVVAVLDGSNKAVFKSKGLQAMMPVMDSIAFKDHNVAKSEYEYEKNGRTINGTSYTVVREQQEIPVLAGF
jgi:hypothetical protein